jgi:glycosyltransferase involved in cell wall biosynthesis
MGCALPVVASQIGGVPETLNFGECGILIPPGDSTALSEALIQLCRDKEKRQIMGAAGRKRAVTEFNVQHVAERILAVYENLF